MTRTLEGRVAMVTGGAGALGRWIVRALVREGARVAVPYLVEEEATELEELLADETSDVRARVSTHRADLAEEASVEALFRAVQEAWGSVTVLCNLAGGFVYASVEETDAETWRRMQDMNATTAFLCSRAAVSGMKAEGWGAIVNVAAVPALERGAASMTAYGASKAAVLNMTWSLARELAPDGIAVNAVVPTVIDTPANRAAMPDADVQGWLDPRDIAEVVRYLAAEPSGIVTGAAIPLSVTRRRERDRP